MLGRFEVLQEIATGGMAKIFLARQKGVEGFEKLVVIKSLLPEFARNRDFVEMFLNEARIAAGLSHPNVVQIYDLGAAEQEYYIAMEFIHGESLAKLKSTCRKTKQLVPLKYTLRVATQVCEGLHYAHTTCDVSGKPLNIVHCDVSPQNILISYDGVVKLVDFGIAKANTAFKESMPGKIKGKIVYMAPEQMRGEALDGRADLFSMGVVLWELVTGKRLFQRSTQAETFAAVLQERIPRPEEVNKHVPEGISSIIMRALERDPNRRFATALEMGKALQSFSSAADLAISSFDVGGFLKELYPDRQEKLRQIAAAEATGQDLSNLLFEDIMFEEHDFSQEISGEINDELSSISSSLYTHSLPSIRVATSGDDMVYFRKMKKRRKVNPLFIVLGILALLGGVGYFFYPQILSFIEKLLGD